MYTLKRVLAALPNPSFSPGHPPGREPRPKRSHERQRDRLHHTEPAYLGDVIAARAKDDGRYEYVGIIQRGEVWSFRHTIGPYRHPPQRASDPTLGPTLPHLDAEAILDDRVVRGLLDAAQALGGGWEFCVGYLTIEFPKQAGTLAPSDEVEELMHRLENRLRMLQCLLPS